jgi:hypothetical protein
MGSQLSKCRRWIIILAVSTQPLIPMSTEVNVSVIETVHPLIPFIQTVEPSQRILHLISAPFLANAGIGLGGSRNPAIWFKSGPYEIHSRSRPNEHRCRSMNASIILNAIQNPMKNLLQPIDATPQSKSILPVATTDAIYPTYATNSVTPIHFLNSPNHTTTHSANEEASTTATSTQIPFP